MNDITDRLAKLSPATDPAAPAAGTVSADLDRGRTARRRRRVRWAAAGTTGCVAAAVAGIIVASTGSNGPSPTRNSHGGNVAIQLVDYTGKQEAGFTVDTVPQGYVLQGSQPSSLDIAPAGDKTSLDVFEGKLVVMLQSIDAKPDTHGTPVTVNGRDGYIRHDDGATTLEYTDGTHDIVVQSWNNIQLTDDQLVQFADGVTVTAAAQAGRG